jgi:hypothetical protein
MTIFSYVQQIGIYDSLVPPNVVVEWPTHRIRILEVSDLNLGPETGYPD